ncbi:putative cyclase [mine drainage metagenome]|uniref:Putative cyclase n=1 Tax=mine drainage metagenome TaxID=410659 RepID=T1BVW2_9ZZZZ
MGRILDISMPLFEGMPCFPGDPAFQSQRSHDMARGDPYNVSTLTFGSHAGTHVDPPNHFVPGGDPIDRVPLSDLNGPCRVLQIPDAIPSIGADDLPPTAPGVTRVLLRTRNSARWAMRLEFFTDFVALDESGARELRRRGIRLVGIDALSIERDTDGTFPVHRELLGASVRIVEGLLLKDVPPGDYELRLAPLKITGGDGGPARAYLLAP